MAPQTFLTRLLDWLLQPVFDFAGRQLTDELSSDRSYGDWPFVPTDDLETRVHSAGDTL